MIRKKVVWLPYDFDTAIGINNEGSLVFSYNLEDTDHIEGGADVFNGQDSVFWCNLRDTYGAELQEMYRRLRSTGVLSYERVEQMFEEHQAKWPEAIFNEDAWFKYIQPLTENGNGAYLAMLQGSKAEQRKWWLYNRFRYLDSKYNAGDALSDVIQLRGYAKADVTVTPYADIYPTVKYGSYLVQTRGTRGTPATLNCPLDNVNDTEIYIYSASQLSSIGDLSGLKVGFADFSNAINLQNVKIGDSDTEYENPNLNAITFGNNVLLKTVDLRNCSAMGTGDQKTIDLSHCDNLEQVLMDGTAITGVQLPNGGVLCVLRLPGTITNLTIQNQKVLTELTVPSFANISTLRLENASTAVDSKEILGAIPANARVRLIGFYWEAEDAAEIRELFSILDGMRGLDENGNNMDKAQVSGTIHTLALTGDEIAELNSRYPYVSITADHTTTTLNYYNYDGSALLHTETIYDGGNGKYTGTPSRASTAQYTYTFLGWNTQPGASAADAQATKNVTTNRNVYAAFLRTVRTYPCRYMDGTTVLQDCGQVPYGNNMPAYTGTTPVKTGVTDPEMYEFVGWNPSNQSITGATDCQPVFQYLGIKTRMLIAEDYRLSEYSNSLVSYIGTYGFWFPRHVNVSLENVSYIDGNGFSISGASYLSLPGLKELVSSNALSIRGLVASGFYGTVSSNMFTGLTELDTAAVNTYPYSLFPLLMGIKSSDDIDARVSPFPNASWLHLTPYFEYFYNSVWDKVSRIDFPEMQSDQLSLTRFTNLQEIYAPKLSYLKGLVSGNNLRSMTLSSRLIYVGDYVFSSPLPNLSYTFDLTDVQYIGTKAFWGCTMASFIVPSVLSVAFFGASAFPSTVSIDIDTLAIGSGSNGYTASSNSNVHVKNLILESLGSLPYTGDQSNARYHYRSLETLTIKSCQSDTLNLSFLTYTDFGSMLTAIYLPSASVVNIGGLANVRNYVSSMNAAFRICVPESMLSQYTTKTNHSNYASLFSGVVFA